MRVELKSVHHLNVEYLISTVGATVNNDSREVSFERYQHGSRNQGRPHLVGEILPLH